MNCGSTAAEAAPRGSGLMQKKAWMLVPLLLLSLAPVAALRQAGARALASSTAPSLRVVLPAASETQLQSPPTPSLNQCFSFAVPAMGIYIAGPLMSLIDAAFIGQTSSVALAALGPASAISDSGPYLLLFLAVAATSLAAKADTSSDDDSVARMAVAAIVCAAVGGTAVATLTLAFVRPLVTSYCGTGCAAATLIPPAIEYVRIRALAFPATVVAAVAQAVLIGQKDTRSPMQSVILAALVNFSLDLVLVVMLGLGVVGAAWATVASQYCAAALLLCVLWRRDLMRLGCSGLRMKVARAVSVTAEHLPTFLGFAPFFLVQIAKLTMHNSAAASAAVLGGAAAAAHTALYSVANTCFTFGDVGSSLSQAWLPAFEARSEGRAGARGATRRGGGSRVDGAMSATGGVDMAGGANGVGLAPAGPTFDLVAAQPTIAQLVRTMLLISGCVVTFATAFVAVGSGSISSDPAVLLQMRRTWPMVVASLVLHGTAVMLEGVRWSDRAAMAQRNRMRAHWHPCSLTQPRLWFQR